MEQKCGIAVENNFSNQMEFNTGNSGPFWAKIGRTTSVNADRRASVVRPDVAYIYYIL